MLGGLRADMSFEAITLKFLETSQEVALEVYLEEKLRLLDPRDPANKMQQTMLATWLLELYLQRLIYLPERDPRRNSGVDDGGSKAVDRHQEAALQEREDLESKLNDFLAEQRGILHEETTFQLLASHGAEDLSLRFAALTQDSPQKYERMAAHHVRRGEWHDVLALLDAAPFANVASLLYKYSLLLLEHLPMETVEVRGVDTVQ